MTHPSDQRPVRVNGVRADAIAVLEDLALAQRNGTVLAWCMRHTSGCDADDVIASAWESARASMVAVLLAQLTFNSGGAITGIRAPTLAEIIAATRGATP